MKKVISCIAGIICITLLFSGCSLVLAPNPDASAPSSKQPDPSEQISTQQTQAVQADPSTSTDGNTAPTAPAVNDPYPQYVQTDIHEIIESSIGLGGYKQTIPISIPKLLPFSEDAISCQAEIQNRFAPKLEEMRSDASQGLSISYLYIEYFVYLNDTVLSLVIHECSTFDLSTYTVYNFDIETGEKLETDQLMEKLQVADYTEKFRQAAKEAFESKYASFRENPTTFYTEQLEATISRENMEKAKPYLAENGQPMIIVNIYAMAGAAYYPEAIPLTQ